MRPSCLCFSKYGPWPGSFGVFLETCQKGRISDLTQIHCSLQSSSEKQNQQKERSAEERDLLYESCSHLLWRLTSPKIHRVTWQARDTGGPMVQLKFKADRLEIQEELMNQFEPKGRKLSCPTSKVIKQEEFSLPWEESAFLFYSGLQLIA